MNTEIKPQIQQIIDLMATKEWKLANNLLADVNDTLDDLIDTTDNDEDLIELSKCQVLLNHLHIKIKNEQL